MRGDHSGGVLSRGSPPRAISQKSSSDEPKSYSASPRRIWARPRRIFFKSYWSLVSTVVFQVIYMWKRYVTVCLIDCQQYPDPRKEGSEVIDRESRVDTRGRNMSVVQVKEK